MPRTLAMPWIALAACLAPAAFQPEAGADERALARPPGPGPVEIGVSFHLLDLQRIDDEAETFEFSGVLALVWKDPQQAFDPAEAKVEEKLYHGEYQFDELAPSWYPQVVLANASQAPERQGLLLRVKPDGTCTLVQDIHAVARNNLNLRRYPFDRQRLEALFQVMGFTDEEAVFAAATEPATADVETINVPQWHLESVAGRFADLPAPYLGSDARAAGLAVSFDVRRQSFFVVRLVIVPLLIIVGLSWCVFWMDRASLADRMNVSFVGLLTAVAYQTLLSDFTPHIAYGTFANSFVTLSFLLISASAGINLLVCLCDRRGEFERGDLIDRRCRRVFPLAHATAILAACVFFFCVD